MTRLYCSGAMTAYGEAGNWGFDNFNRAEKELIARGYEVENPASKGIVNGFEWSDYLRYDLTEMMKCDGVALLPDWGMSKGAQLEVYVAKALGMPVCLVAEWLDRAEL